MTLFQIIQILKEIALTQPNIKSATDGSIYDVMNTNPSVKYDVVHFSQTTHQSDEETDYYGLNIFYVSRLEDSLEDNRLQIQSIGKEVLDNIIRTFCENWGIDFPVITYTPFTQKFNDLCAGCYCNLRLEIPKEIICADDFTAEVVPGSGIKLQDIGITITQNGLVVVTPDAEYDGIGEVRIEVDVPQSAAVLQDKEVEYTANGSYTVTPDSNYDGLSSVSVDVDVPDRYDEGYDDGKDDGEAEQKAKLTVTSFTENNTYTRADGWSAVTVDVPQTGQTINNQPWKTIDLWQLNKNDTRKFELLYSDKLGYYYATKPGVEVEATYDSGYTGLEKAGALFRLMPTEAIMVGEAEQKVKMSALTVTANGEYNREDGWSAVTVNVPQTGQTINNQTKSYLISEVQTQLIYYDKPGDEKWIYTLKNKPVTITYDSGYTGLEKVRLDLLIDASAAIELGENQQKAKLVTTAFTENGTYTREDGYSAITVNVDDRYDEGYEDGYKDGSSACSGFFISSITLNVESAITDYGTATTTYSPSTAFTNIYYTSSDPSIASIDSATGIITVYSSGTVTICTTDAYTHLQDCKSVNVTKSQGYYTLYFVYETTGNDEEVIFYDTANLPDSSSEEQRKSSGTRTWVNNLVSMEIDGVSMQPVSAYTFDNPGKHIVKYNTPVGTVPDYLFSLAKNPHPKSSAQNEKLVEAHMWEGFGVLLNNAFDGDTNLTAVTLPNTLKVLGLAPFRNTGIKEIVIPNSVTANTEITDYRPYVQRYVMKSEDDYWFSGCTSLSSVTIGTGVSVVPVYCFESCTSLSSITIPNNVTRICDGAFKENLTLTGVTIPTGLTGIGMEAFLTTSLSSAITLPDSLKTIGSWAFTNAKNVRTVTFGTSITSIASNAFYFTNITAMTFNGTTPPTLGNEDALGPNNREGFVIYVPSTAVNTYKSAWPYYENNITAKP